MVLVFRIKLFALYLALTGELCERVRCSGIRIWLKSVKLYPTVRKIQFVTSLNI